MLLASNVSSRRKGVHRAFLRIFMRFPLKGGGQVSRHDNASLPNLGGHSVLSSTQPSARSRLWSLDSLSRSNRKRLMGGLGPKAERDRRQSCMRPRRKVGGALGRMLVETASYVDAPVRRAVSRWMLPKHAPERPKAAPRRRLRAWRTTTFEPPEADASRSGAGAKAPPWLRTQRAGGVRLLGTGGAGWATGPRRRRDRRKGGAGVPCRGSSFKAALRASGPNKKRRDGIDQPKPYRRRRFFSAARERTGFCVLLRNWAVDR